MEKKGQKIYHCGSLSYTLPQLYMLFFWLLLGATSMSMANCLPGNILPIQLKNLPLSDTAKWLILGCIGTVLNVTINPYISVASDLYRSKLGRRIPFIIASLPPIVLALVLFAFTHFFGEKLSTILQPYWETSPATMIAVVMGIVMFIFQFFMMWVNSVIWYIFIDIVPAEFFSRIMAVMRLGLQLGTAIFSYFLFPLAKDHAGAIFIGAAIFYAVGMGCFCFFVKEGTYPPLTPEQIARKNARGIDILSAKIKGVKEFVSITFCHRVYVYRYLTMVFSCISGAAGTFGYFLMSMQLNMTDEHIGHMNGICGMIGALGIFTAVVVALLVNKWHPLRISVYNSVFSLCAVPFALRWVFGTLDPNVYVTLCIISSLTNLLMTGLLAICEQPSEMLLFPKSRYGTFCAMQASLRSAGTLVFGFIVAKCFDFISTHFDTCYLAVTYGDKWHYRLIQVWWIPWALLAYFMAYKLYRTWASLGGYKNYSSPAPWGENGREHVDRLPCEPVKPSHLKRMLRFFDVLYLVYGILVPLQAVWHCRWRLGTPWVNPENPTTENFVNRLHDFFCTGGDPSLFKSYLIAPTICVILAIVLWICLRIHLNRKADSNPDGTGLVQPALLSLLMVIHFADLIANQWVIACTPGNYGVILTLISCVSLILTVVAVALISYMERGVTVPPPEVDGARS